MQKINIITDAPGGAELALKEMDDDLRMNIGRSTYRFVRELMRNPQTRKLIQEKKAEFKAAGIL